MSDVSMEYRTKLSYTLLGLSVGIGITVLAMNIITPKLQKGESKPLKVRESVQQMAMADNIPQLPHTRRQQGMPTQRLAQEVLDMIKQKKYPRKGNKLTLNIKRNQGEIKTGLSVKLVGKGFIVVDENNKRLIGCKKCEGALKTDYGDDCGAAPFPICPNSSTSANTMGFSIFREALATHKCEDELECNGWYFYSPENCESTAH